MSTFCPDRLLAVLQTLPTTPCYWVAYSGGRDSQVLLHAMAVLRGRYEAGLRAVYVNHDLHAQAEAWGRHCEECCARQGIQLERVKLTLKPARGQSLEALAREARYRAMAELLGEGDTLLTAHHQNDQAETVLLQLLRGSGPDGLAGMPDVTTLGRGFLARPLLGFSRDQLEDYASRSSLSWVDDSTNLNLDFDRNFLRHRVIPRIAERWPSLGTTLARSARHCGEARHLIDELAARDRGLVSTQGSGVLSVKGVLGLPEPRRRSVLRHWLREQGLALPDSKHLERISHEVLAARPDRMPQIAWPGVEIRRYRDGLYAMSALPFHDAGQRLDWDGTSPLVLPDGLGVLHSRSARGRGVKTRLWEKASVRVGFRQGGEHCRPAGRGHRHKLKKLFQEQGIPPWERDRIPLLYLDDQLAAVSGLWVCEPFQAAPGELGVEAGIL